MIRFLKSALGVFVFVMALSILLFGWRGLLCFCCALPILLISGVLYLFWVLATSDRLLRRKKTP